MPPPVLLLTRIWPSRERPSLGRYVRDRAAGIDRLRIVRPRWPRAWRILVYPLLLVDALRAGPTIRGVEAHMLLPTGLIGLLVARMRRVPVVVYSHGGDVRNWRRLPAPLRWLARRVARRADRILTNSADTANYLRELGAHPIVVPPGVDLAAYRPTPRPSDRRVLYLGGRNERKGYSVAEALADTLVGPWLNEVPPGEIPALIASHDVVLIPSLAEPFGLVAVEAIASGRWVVARDVGGLREIIEEGVNGTLVADGDFARALSSVPEYDPERIARTVDRYSLARWQAAMDAVWDELSPAADAR